MFSRALSPTAELRTLEPWQAEEFAAHLERAGEHIRPWVAAAFVTHGVEAARATLERFADRTAHDGGRLFGIWDDGVLVGGVMFVTFDATTGICEIGCWLEPGAEGHGLITAACRILVDWAFTVRGMHRIEWYCRADNERSAAVAKRLGMTVEGVHRDAIKVDGEYYGKQVWSLLSSD
jgi:ribosomal-protein-serine acetyltransferase